MVQAAYLAGRAQSETGNHEQAITLLEDASRNAADLTDSVQKVEIELAIGRAFRALGRFQVALERTTKAQQLAERIGDVELTVDALNLQASVVDALGQHQRALDTLNRARRAAVAGGLDSLRLASIGTNIGERHRILGNHLEALEHLKDAYDRFKRANVRSRASNANLISLGILYRRMGKQDEAQPFYEEARESALETGDNQVLAAALNNLAGIALNNEQTDRAETLFAEALEMAERAGSLQYQADNLDGLGRVYLAQGRIDEAAASLEGALKLSRDMGYRHGELESGINLATAQLAAGEANLAIETLEESVRLATEIQDRMHLISGHEILSRAYEYVGDFRSALQHGRRFHEEESILYDERNEERTRQLTIKFELERSNHQAEMYRLKSQFLQQAREEAEANVRTRTKELEEAQVEIVTRLAVAAEFRDDDTGTHTRRVGRNAAAIGFAMGLPESECQLLFTAARLHDVGKIGIPDSILLKSERLEGDEVALMRRHAEIGARILSSGGSKLLHVAETISLSHHERYDGTGYPSGIAGEDIPLAARIVAVSDVLDALTHARPYKLAWPVSEALAEIASQRGRQFDPDTVDACLLVFGGEGGFSPTDDTPAWDELLERLKVLGASRGFPAVSRAGVW